MKKKPSHGSKSPGKQQPQARTRAITPHRQQGAGTVEYLLLTGLMIAALLMPFGEEGKSAQQRLMEAIRDQQEAYHYAARLPHLPTLDADGNIVGGNEPLNGGPVDQRWPESGTGTSSDTDIGSSTGNGGLFGDGSYGDGPYGGGESSSSGLWGSNGIEGQGQSSAEGGFSAPSFDEILQQAEQSALDDKAQWVQCRQESVAAAQQQARRLPANSAQQAEQQATAERLRADAVARERAELLLHLHNPEQPTPAGWKEAGNHQASRDQLKLSAKRLTPGRSDFQAGVYAPNRNVMGSLFSPMLAATGSPSSSEGWHNAAQQTANFQPDAYDRHVQLTAKVRLTSPANAADSDDVSSVASDQSATARAPCAEEGVVEVSQSASTAGLSARSRPGAARIQEINQRLERDGEALSGSERQALIDERTAILVLRDKRDRALERACHYYAGGSREACQFERSLLYSEFLTWGDLDNSDRDIFHYYHHAATQWGNGEQARITEISRQALSDIVIDTLTAPVVMGKIAGQAALGDEESQALLREMGDEIKAFAANPAKHISESIREQLAHADALEQAGRRDEADLVRMRLMLEKQTTLLGAGGVAASLPRFVSKVLRPEDVGVDGSGSGGSQGLLWGSWSDYPKVKVEGREYAQIGGRLYSRHAVDRMQPSGLGAPAGADGPGRNVTPNIVEEVITRGTTATTIVNDVQRTSYTLGNVRVWTEGDGKTIITILRIASQ